jgi:hypothetical protein
VNENNETHGLSSWSRLWHPRGVQVTLPLSPDPANGFAAALNQVSAALDAGWLAQAPGLEEGEQKDMVSGIARGIHEKEGRCTPYVLLYSASAHLIHPILKCYLDTKDQIEAFEYAAKFKLDKIPLYDGTDKPARDNSQRAKRNIVTLQRHFGVVFKPNPKYDEAARAAVVARGDIYKVAKDVFVRWIDVKPQADPEPADDKKPAITANGTPTTGVAGSPAPAQAAPGTPDAGRPGMSPAEISVQTRNAFLTRLSEASDSVMLETAIQEIPAFGSILLEQDKAALRTAVSHNRNRLGRPAAK